jgi:hypothetical protein
MRYSVKFFLKNIQSNFVKYKISSILQLTSMLDSIKNKRYIMKSLSTAFLLVLVTLLFSTNTMYSNSQSSQSSAINGTPTYIKNLGQWNEQIQYLARTPNMDVWVTTKGIVFDAYSYNKQNKNIVRKGTVLTMDFHSTQPIVSSSEDISTSVFNFYYGKEKNWKENVPSYNQVLLKEVYKGIDAVLLFDETKPRYDFIVKPGANPKDIKFTFSGEVLATYDKDHEVQINTILGSLVNSKLFAYQMIDGKKVTIPCFFDATLTSDGVEMSFDVGQYDNTKSLVIDPVVYFSFLGSAGAEEIRSMKIASDKSIILAGWTTSGTFPTTTGSYQEISTAGETDAFITRLNPTMSSIVYSTYIGGSGADTINKIVLDVDNNIYCVGTTTSADFPTSAVAAFKTFGGQSDAFVTKFNFNGTLNFSTFFGGNGVEYGNSIAINSGNEPFIVGGTFSTNLPKTAISVDDTYNGGGDGFIAKFDANGASLNTTSYLGRSGSGTGNQVPSDFDVALDIAIAPNGTIHIVGETRSGSFPSIPLVTSPPAPPPPFAPFDRTYNGGADAFIVKMVAQASQYTYSTFFGGAGDDRAVAVTTTPDNLVLVLGTTNSTNSFGAVPGGFQSAKSGMTDFFIAEFDLQSKPNSFTYFGSNSDEFGTDIAIDQTNGDIYISGSTNSSGMAILGTDVQTTNMGGTDGYIAQFNSTLLELKYSTFIGGTGFDRVNEIIVDNAGDIYYAGISSANNLPKSTMWPSYQGTYNGGSSDGLVGKFSKNTLSISTPADGSTICPGQNVVMQWQTSYPAATPFTVELSINNGPFVQTGNTVTVNQFSYLVPANTPSNSKIRLRVRHASGIQATTGELNVGSVPVITTQPSNVTVCEGDTIRLQIQATGDGLTYEWRKGASLIPNSNSNTFIITNAKLTDAGTFNCTVRGECIPFPVSTNATVTVRRKSTITSQPPNRLNHPQGTEAEFCVDAVGSNLTYQWYRNGESLGSSFPSTQTRCLKITNASTNFNGDYTCVVSGDCGMDISEIGKLDIGTSVSSGNDNHFATFTLNTPTSGIVTINPAGECTSKISIVNSIGLTVMNLQSGTIYSSTILPFDMSSLPSGIYWISVECGTQRTILQVPIIR